MIGRNSTGLASPGAVPLIQFRQPRRAAHLKPEAVRLGHHTRQCRTTQVRCRHHQGRRQPALVTQPIQHRAGVLHGAEDRITLDATTGRPVAGRQQAFDPKAVPPVAGQGTQEQIAILGLANDQHRRGIGVRGHRLWSRERNQR